MRKKKRRNGNRAVGGRVDPPMPAGPVASSPPIAAPLPAQADANSPTESTSTMTTATPAAVWVLGTGEAAAPAAKPEERTSSALADFTVLQGRRWHVTLGVLFAATTALVGGTYSVVDYMAVRPSKDKQAELQQAATTLEKDLQTLKSKYERLQSQYSVLLATTTRPIAVFPPDGASIIGTTQTFLWDYVAHNSTSGYILEIRNLTDPAAPPILKNAVRPEARRDFHALAELPAAEYLWRVRPGVLTTGGQEVAVGEWSGPAAFKVYATVADRIRTTGKLRLATTPTSYDAFVASTGDGGYRGFEVDLVSFLAAELTKRLNLPRPLTVDRPLEIPWARLFVAMQHGEADIAIRSITRSAAREREYPNLRFTDGYLRNHQVFVRARPEGDFPGALKKTIVGVKENSLNELAARQLAPKYDFRVDASYTAYGDLYQALRSGTINFALVDSVLVAKFIDRGDLFQMGPTLDSELKEFYQRELEHPTEEYAILVHDGGPKDTLRETINEILNSPAGKDFLSSLRKKYRLKD